ncbi:hypothetical protein E2562_015133 [Oryza meyeriana var. granulata]|uniref:Uncharacterized protein n=1 Tax=Oryza meyeriana var. granulata TaxID=110450 RepID=A0A6G1DVU2_9ORYZ|nr:hypothetical protein E2562_015133 [Oryza meyeriana var. granulata]
MAALVDGSIDTAVRHPWPELHHPPMPSPPLCMAAGDGSSLSTLRWTEGGCRSDVIAARCAGVTTGSLRPSTPPPVPSGVAPPAPSAYPLYAPSPHRFRQGADSFYLCLASPRAPRAIYPAALQALLGRPHSTAAGCPRPHHSLLLHPPRHHSARVGLAVTRLSGGGVHESPERHRLSLLPRLQLYLSATTGLVLAVPASLRLHLSAAATLPGFLPPIQAQKWAGSC